MPKPILLIIDDEPDMSFIIQEFAEGIGYFVLSSTTVNKAKILWSEIKPLAIILDVVMPDMDAHELIQWLVRQKSSTPILLMSGYGQKYLSPVMKLGRIKGAPIVGVIEKPFSISRLQQNLIQFLEPAFLWTKDMSVGDDTLDDQNQVLLALLHDLRVGIRENENEKSITTTLNEIFSLMKSHFSHEELLMEASGYPGLSNHKKSHDQAVEKVEEYLTFMSGTEVRPIDDELVELLANWLQVHIKEEDKEYRTWRNELLNELVPT